MVRLEKPELYDISRDPGETRDVSAQFPDLVEKLLALAEADRAVLGDALKGKKGTENRPAGKMEEK